jgi:excisionase family DNA binding protein
VSGDETEILTTRQVAERLNVGRSAVNWMVKRGELHPEKRVTELGSEYLVFQRDEVEALAERRKKEAVEPPRNRRGRPPRMPRTLPEK